MAAAVSFQSFWTFSRRAASLSASPINDIPLHNKRAYSWLPLPFFQNILVRRNPTKKTILDN
jgi:hypothetical protein